MGQNIARSLAQSEPYHFALGMDYGLDASKGQIREVPYEVTGNDIVLGVAGALRIFGEQHKNETFTTDEALAVSLGALVAVNEALERDRKKEAEEE